MRHKILCIAGGIGLGLMGLHLTAWGPESLMGDKNSISSIAALAMERKGEATARLVLFLRSSLLT